jgi:hypothetical protein
VFGYVTVNQDELKIREYRRYRSFYCGLCRSLKTRCGIRGQAILPYDMVFLDILLNGLYELPLAEEDRMCIAHPTKKQHMVRNEITDYAADMGMLLAYYKLLDDGEDEGSKLASSRAMLLKKHAGAIGVRWPEQAEAVRQYIRKLNDAEKQNVADLDAVAGLTGDALGAIFVMKEDLWSDVLRRMGFFLGKYVYLLDAYEDLEKDLKRGAYNPFRPYAGRKDFDAFVENALTMMMAECAKEFEKLPIVQDIDILRNIIYSGVWQKYQEVRRKRDGAEEEGEA